MRASPTSRKAAEVLPGVSSAKGLRPIGEASGYLGVHPRTLMAYERMGLVKPLRQSNRRLYSDDELRWLGCVQRFNREGGISLQGLATLLRFVPCWAVRSQIGARGGGACCPAAYPAEESLARVRRAYGGSAPEPCRGCGIYGGNRGRAAAALEEGVAVPVAASA